MLYPGGKLQKKISEGGVRGSNEGALLYGRCLTRSNVCLVLLRQKTENSRGKEGTALCEKPTLWRAIRNSWGKGPTRENRRRPCQQKGGTLLWWLMPIPLDRWAAKNQSLREEGNCPKKKVKLQRKQVERARPTSTTSRGGGVPQKSG